MQEHMKCPSQLAAESLIHVVAVTGPCGPSLVLATSQLCEQLSFAPDVHGTHATATFLKRRLLLLLLLLLLILLIIGVNAGAYEMH